VHLPPIAEENTDLCLATTIRCGYGSFLLKDWPISPEAQEILMVQNCIMVFK